MNRTNVDKGVPVVRRPTLSMGGMISNKRKEQDVTIVLEKY
jgi:hypothetical protein